MAAKPTARRTALGFTLVELIVVLALIVILAALIIPSTVRTLDRERIDAAETALQDLSDGIRDFGNRVGEFPGDLRHLVEQIVSGDRDCSGSRYSSTERSRWRGPYIGRLVPSTGLPVAIGTVVLPILEDTATGNARMTVVNVLEEDAIALNDQVDGDGSSSAGTVRWTPPDAQGFVTLYYQTPYRC